MKYIFYLCFFLKGFLHTESQTLKLGNSSVTIIKLQSGEGKTIVHLHENETTALMAAKLYVEAQGGTLITLRHSGKRNIRFSLNKINYEFDPNRIFTEQGIKGTLNEFGSYSIAAHMEIKHLAKEFLKLIPVGRVIAVHNNQDYSIKDYLPSYPLRADVIDLNYLKANSFRNFYLVTSVFDYERLKDLSYNVALQSPLVKDDGSLSYYYAQTNYINVEAAYGDLKAQIKMLFNA